MIAILSLSLPLSLSLSLSLSNDNQLSQYEVIINIKDSRVQMNEKVYLLVECSETFFHIICNGILYTVI